MVPDADTPPPAGAMDENRCPHCQYSPCLPLWRKLMLGPASSARCAGCGYKVGVSPLPAMLVMLPLFLLPLSITLGLLSDAVVAVMLLLVLLPVCGVLYAVVPLAPREVTNPRLVQAASERIAAEKQARRG